GNIHAPPSGTHPPPKDRLMPMRRNIIDEQVPAKPDCARAAQREAGLTPRKEQTSAKRKRNYVDEEQETNDPDIRPQKLTRRNLHLLQQALADTGPDMESFSSSVASKDTETSKKNVTSRDPNVYYEMKLRGCEFAHFDEDEPDDADEVLVILDETRRSSPTDLDPKSFRRKAYNCVGEQHVIANVTKNLVIDLDAVEADPRRYFTENVSWSAPDYTVLGPFFSKNRLAVPKADLTFGHTVTAFTKWTKAVAEIESSGPNIYMEDKGLAFFPYFTAETKSDNGSLRVAHWQSMHNVLAMACNNIALANTVGTVEKLLGKVLQ
ncbi:MAG: hypothetical protein M1814_005799, partial [Vezdaea aestivalis]